MHIFSLRHFLSPSVSSLPSPAMDSGISAISLCLLFVLCSTFSLVHSSTIGVAESVTFRGFSNSRTGNELLPCSKSPQLVRFSAGCFLHTFLASNSESSPRISGFTGVEILAGLHWYLKNQCGSHISWGKTGGAQLFSVPRAGMLPRVKNADILVQKPIPWNYYQNAVTSSYSFAWWDWKRWEKEIDWMVLQGINLPLAFTGQEAIWQKVFQKFNVSKTDLDDFFGGPAFLAWSRMGNLHGWGEALPQSWLDQQLILQKKILLRMYLLGMTPVLPAFSGNIPAG